MTTNNDTATTTNKIAMNGEHRCHCGCKYWEHDVCIDCGTKITAVGAAEVTVYLVGQVTSCFIVKFAALTPIPVPADCIGRKVRVTMDDYITMHHMIRTNGEYITFI